MALINSWRDELYILFSFLWWFKMSITWACLSSRSEEIIRIKKVINTPPFSHLQRLTTWNISRHSLLQFSPRKTDLFKGGIQMSTQNLFMTFLSETGGENTCAKDGSRPLSRTFLRVPWPWFVAELILHHVQIYNRTISVQKQSCSSNLPVQLKGFPACKSVNWEPNLGSLRII